MLNKKVMILIIFFISLLAISVVSAADNSTTDAATSAEDTTQEVVDLEETTDDLISNEENTDSIESDEILCSQDDADDLSRNVDEDVLGASPPYNMYSLSVSDTTLTYGKSGSVKISITPASGYSYAYDFYFRVYDSNNNQKISKNYYSSSSKTQITHSIGANELSSGTYTIKLVNYADSKVMDTATLNIVNVPYSAYSVRVSSTSFNYGTSGSIAMSVTPASSSYNYRYDFYLKVYDSNNNQKISKRYYSTSSTYSTTQLTYSVGSTALSPGSYTIKILNNGDNHVITTSTFIVNDLPYYAYSVSVSDTNIYYQKDGSIVMSISPASSGYDYRYDFYLKIYDSSNNVKISKRYYSTSSSAQEAYNVASGSLPIGRYTIKIINDYDNQIMDTATLNVKSMYNIESRDVTGWCDKVIQFKVRASEGGRYKSGLSVSFTCNNKQYSAKTDKNGYATLKIHLKSGTYAITTKYGDAVKKNKIVIKKRYVGNKYRNVKVSSPSAYYGQDKKITYGFEGNMKGCIKIYKGKSLKYSKSFDTRGYINDYFKYNKHSYSYSVNNLNSVGRYTVKIIGGNGKVLAQSKFKIKKSPTRIKSFSFKTLGGYKETIWGFLFSKYGSYWDIGGKAKFKIGGKIYKVKVKHGDAKVKVKFPSKKKIYKCKVKFLGDKNHKASSTKFKIKTTKIKNPIKVGKYRIKLTSKQYKSISKAVHNGNYKSKVIKTNYQKKFKKPYYKQIKKYKTTKSVYTWYGSSYMPTKERMWSKGWIQVSEYKYTKKNPYNKYGIGLSAYTFAITKWVKISYKLAYKTKYYPVKAKITTSYIPMEKPKIKIYSHGHTLRNGKVAFA